METLPIDNNYLTGIGICAALKWAHVAKTGYNGNIDVINLLYASYSAINAKRVIKIF